jgi:hypothetical protein
MHLFIFEKFFINLKLFTNEILKEKQRFTFITFYITLWIVNYFKTKLPPHLQSLKGEELGSQFSIVEL